MSEYATGLNNPGRQEAIPTMELAQIIEAMSPQDRIDHKRQWLSDISDREMLCRLVDEINEQEGIEVEEI